MANFEKRVPENVEGDFFADSTCIDCDTCRQVAPEAFAESDALSIGTRGTEEARVGPRRLPPRHRGARLLLRLQPAEVLGRQWLLRPAPRGELAERLAASRDYCWHSWPLQVASMERLAAFAWVLPGHGQRVHLPREVMRRQVDQLWRSMGRGP